MEIEEVIGHFVKEVARLGMDHLLGCTEPGRVCAHCRNELEAFSLALPCCGRTLCHTCTARALVHQWQTRGVVVCDDCQTAHTFEVDH
jgi:hypothetical protein